MNLIEVLQRTSAGLHSVASAASTNLSTPMRARAEEMDQAIILLRELIIATDRYLELGRDIDNSTGHAASERLYKALRHVRPL